jgi:acid phosphatase (class A)
MKLFKFLPLACIALLITSCATSNVSDTKEIINSGYLSKQELPDSLKLLPAPPAPNSSALALDEQIVKEAVQLRDTARWQLAISDADLSFPNAAGTFSCALNAPITEQDTPTLYKLLQRAMIDANSAVSAAKKHYQRLRPFQVNKLPLCTPNEAEHLSKNGSYPSGHTTIGWTWALLLSELSPEQADAILIRGLEYGNSRNICNAHWHSDVVQARVMAASTVAKLHAKPEFQTDLALAKQELAVVRAKGLKPIRDCNAEASALAIKVPWLK